MNACDPEVLLHNHHQLPSAIYILNEKTEIKVESLIIKITKVREQERNPFKTSTYLLVSSNLHLKKVQSHCSNPRPLSSF